MASRVHHIALWFCLGQAIFGGGCSQGNTPEHLDFTLPKLEFIFSTAPTPNDNEVPTALAQALVGSAPNMICAGPQALGTDCCEHPSADCFTYPIACDEGTDYCAIMVMLKKTVEVDLAAEVPEIGALSGTAFSSASITAIRTDLKRSSDSLGGRDALPIRAADLYLWPKDSPSRPAPTHLGHVNLALGQKVVVPDLIAQQVFSGLVRDYPWRFSILLTARLAITADTKNQVVEGQRDLVESLTFTVTVQATAHY